MYAYKIRRDEDYVVRPIKTATHLPCAHVSDGSFTAVTSPARMLQKRLTDRIVIPSASERAGGLSPIGRAGTITLAALLLWVAFIGTALFIFGQASLIF